jgi:hypothetical protein
MAGKRNCDDALLLALAGGLGIAAAARQAQVHERTVRRRLADADFRRRVNEARAAMVGEAVGRLALAGGLAAVTLAQLVKDAASDAVKLGACRAVLEHMFRGVEVDTLARQLAELAREVEALKHDRGGADTPAGEGAGRNGLGAAG